MAVADKLTAIAQKINDQVSKANTATGGSDTTLDAALQTLCDGYGQGDGSGLVFSSSVMYSIRSMHICRVSSVAPA